VDTITQAALGAVIGELGWRRSLGARAGLFGLICGLLPDADIVAAITGPWNNLAFHRSWTHSLLVLPLAAPLVGLAARRAFRDDGPSRPWMHLAFWGLITHPLLDVCTTYGTQLLAPLSDRRFSIDAVSIIDPVFTAPLLAALLLGRLPRVPEALRSAALALSLVFGVAYLGLGWCWSQQARAAAAVHLAEIHGAGVHRTGDVELRTPPMLLFGPNRKIVAISGERRWSGVFSALADDEVTLRELTSDRGDALDAALTTREGRIWAWFTDGYMQVRISTHTGGARTVEMTDMKYGLYTDPTRSVFVARAEIDASGAVEAVTRSRPSVSVEPGTELRAGWILLWQGADALAAFTADRSP